MSEAVMLALIPALASLAIVMVNTFMAFQMAKLNTKATAAAEKVDEVKAKAEEAAQVVKEVKTNLENSNAHVDNKLTDIHTLVNSNMGIQLKISAAALKRVALITKDQADIDASNEADSLLKEHEANQEIVDKE